MNQVDVVVVGAGPAGSTAAYYLAKAGLTVVLLDKADFPRDKPCGGGLTVKTLRLLHCSLEGVTENAADKMLLGNGQGTEIEAPLAGVFCQMVQRPKFDNTLKEQAVQAGARFVKIAGIRSIQQDAHQCVLETEEGATFTARWCIAADGAKSQLRRLLHRKATVQQVFALEGKVYEKTYSKVVFDFFAVPWGYGWIFPKADHLNVGIITFNRRIKLSREQVLEYCQQRLGHRNLKEVVGHPLGVGPGNGALALGRTLFVGDAAGNVEALLGEGIHNAVYSGRQAARALIPNWPPVFTRLLFRTLMLRQTIDLQTSKNLSLIFYGFPKMGWFLLKHPYVLRRLMHGFAQGRRLDRIVRGF